MNKLYDFDYYKNKVWEKYESCFDGSDEMMEKMQKRFEHSLRVVDMTIQLIQIHKLPIDIEKAKVTAMLHDYAKFCSLDEYKMIANEVGSVEEVSEKNKKVLHALLGRYIVEKELNIDDEEILLAIETHTTGNKNMSPLQEVIYLADCVEDGRPGEYFQRIRTLAKHNMKRALAQFLKDTIERLSQDPEKTMHPYSKAAYQDYKKYLLNGNNKYELVLDALDHNLIKDVKVYETKESNPYFDYIIVATTLSSRQMEACISYLKDDFDIRGAEVGDSWSLIDLNDIVIHIFKEEERERYGLDRLYASLPQIK